MLYRIRDYQNKYGIEIDGIINTQNISISKSIYSETKSISATIDVYALSPSLIAELNNFNQDNGVTMFPISPIDTVFYAGEISADTTSGLDLTVDGEMKIIRKALNIQDSIAIEPFVIGDYDGTI